MALFLYYPPHYFLNFPSYCPSARHTDVCMFMVKTNLFSWRLIRVKAVFKDYKYSKLSDGCVYHTSTSFKVVGKKINTAKMLHFIERHINSSVYLYLEAFDDFCDRYYLYSYRIMKNGKWIGYCNFIEGANTANLVYYHSLHEIGLNYGDYILAS